MAAPIIHLRSTDGTEASHGAPRLARGSLEGLIATAALPGGGSASQDTGPTPSGVPTSGWTLTAGTSSGYANGRVRAVFAGNGSGADGYFTLGSNSTLTSLVVTSVGSGYTGVVTVTPAICPISSVVFDLGKDWHQYSIGQVSFTALPQSDSVLRTSITAGREATASDFMCVGWALSGGGLTSAWYSPVTGGSPSMQIRLGGRFIKIDVVMGMSTSGASVSLLAFPN